MRHESPYEPSLLLRFAEWLDSHAWSTQLHESLWTWPLVESTHVLTLMLSVGMLAVVDLRLLGVAFKDTAVSQLTRRLLPWSVAGFAIMMITGLMLFYAKPVHTTHSVWFRAKVLLLIAAGVNAWLFHKRVSRDRAQWDHQARPPAGVRASAALSLGIWACVIVFGRLIAYNWFDCGPPQPAFIVWAAGCAPETAQ